MLVVRCHPKRNVLNFSQPLGESHMDSRDSQVCYIQTFVSMYMPICVFLKTGDPQKDRCQY